MHSSLKSALLVVAAVSLVSACSKKQEIAPSPAPAPAVVNVEPAPPPPPPVQPPPAPPAAAGFEGEWKGSSGEDLPISFSIEGNQVTSMNASYAGRSGSCSFNGSISSSGPAAISDKTFTAKGDHSRDGNPIAFTATGTLTSSTEASGTLVWKGKSSICGDIDLQYQWTAKKEPAAPIEPE
jgi:hypothetical protein